MSIIHQDSAECLKSELDLFTVPPTQASIDKGISVEYPTVNSLTDDGPLEFFCASSPGEYLDLAQTQLYIQVKIVKKENDAALTNEKVVPVNLFLHSMFSQCDVSLNERLVSPSSNTYSYRAYLSTVLNYGMESKRSQLTSALYYKDTAGSVLKMDSCDPSVSDTDPKYNAGLVKRNEFVKDSKTFDMLGPLHSDLFMQPRLLLPGVDLKVKLIRNDPSFSLMNDEGTDFKVKIMRAALFIRKVKVSPTLLSSHMKALEKTTAKYPVNRTEIRTFSIPAGSYSVTKDNLCMGQLPTKLVIGFVDSDAFTGNYRKNPYNFQANDLNYLALYMDGEQIPAKPYTPNFSDKNAVREYNSLFSVLDIQFKDAGIGISRQEYVAGGYCLTAFDMTNDSGNGSYFSLVKSGNLRLEARFKSMTPRSITAVCYLTFENIIQIDSHRNVLVDYL